MNSKDRKLTFLVLVAVPLAFISPVLALVWFGITYFIHRLFSDTPLSD